MIVADVNILAYLLIEGPFTALAEAVHEADAGWMMPRVWQYEFSNVCTTSVRERIITHEQGVDAVVNAPVFVQEPYEDVSRLDVLELSVSTKVATYDCEYVVLARKLLVPLVTNDKQLLRLFDDVAISMQAFVDRQRGDRAT